jgi:hypothetical protein
VVDVHEIDYRGQTVPRQLIRVPWYVRSHQRGYLIRSQARKGMPHILLK